jgi:hypothetical protein
MSIKLKSLLEGYAWERKADGSLPTLRDSIAVHEANSGAKPDFLDLDGDGNEKESMKSAAADNSSTNYGNYINKARAKSHLTKKDGTVYGHDASGNATKLNSTSDVDNPKYKKWTIKSESVNEYGEREFDRSSQMYGGGKSSRESNGNVSELVEKIEDCVERLMQNLSTNSNVPTSEKSVILKELVKISDLIDTLQDEI